MRKTALLILFALAAISAQAQTIYDAQRFSEREYEGTARSVAMGNAFTALGGDLGSIGINPAGSAVANYSQFTITPGLTISSNTTKGVSPYTDGYLPYFERQFKNTATHFAIPNLGMTFNWKTGRKSGLKNVTFGFVMNRVNSWNEDLHAAGRNATTSFMGAMAAEATWNRMLGSNLNMKNAYDYDPWKYVVGYQSGMISTFGGYDDQFVGASELIFDNMGQTEISLGGPLDQSYGRQVRGAKNDYLINLGFNISDFLYLGANLGITSMNYSYDEYFKEVAVDPSDFGIEFDNGQKIYFDNMKYKYSYGANTSGVYGKFGFILTPGFGLRIGGAIQTPTATTVTEYWYMSGETAYTDNSFNAAAESPEGEDRYRFSEPWRANLGVAYTLGKFAVFSVDYEMCNYSNMKFKRSGFDDDREYFIDLNEDINSVFGTSHMLRAGVEVKPVDRLALRAGYGITTSPEMNEIIIANDIANIYPIDVPASQNIAFGLGFISRKSFFADIACRYAFATDEYFMPYSDYIFDSEGYVIEYAPEILNIKDNWKVLLTLGWRF